MRGTLAKRIRKFVRKEYSFLLPEPTYIRNRHTGRIQLAQQCQRALVQHMKRTYKKRKTNGEIIQQKV